MFIVRLFSRNGAPCRPLIGKPDQAPPKSGRHPSPGRVSFTLRPRGWCSSRFDASIKPVRDIPDRTGCGRVRSAYAPTENRRSKPVAVTPDAFLHRVADIAAHLNLSEDEGIEGLEGARAYNCRRTTTAA